MIKSNNKNKNRVNNTMKYKKHCISVAQNDRNDYYSEKIDEEICFKQFHYFFNFFILN